jgi:toxin ParE1/3/4
MVRIVLFHPKAAKEYRLAQRWYVRRSLKAAQRFQQAIERVIERLETAAEQGTPFRANYHWMRARRFPYLLYYEIFSLNLVWVYAVAHGRRRSGYWLRRAQP